MDSYYDNNFPGIYIIGVLGTMTKRQKVDYGNSDDITSVEQYERAVWHPGKENYVFVRYAKASDDAPWCKVMPRYRMFIYNGCLCSMIFRSYLPIPRKMVIHDRDDITLTTERITKNENEVQQRFNFVPERYRRIDTMITAKMNQYNEMERESEAERERRLIQELTFREMTIDELKKFKEKRINKKREYKAQRDAQADEWIESVLAEYEINEPEDDDNG